MTGIVLFKMTGSGNDFVFVDGRSSRLADWTPEAISAICDRQRGVGADGIAVLEPSNRAGAVRLHYFNRDGSPAALCGNASLCATRLAAYLELAPAEGMDLETGAGVLSTRCLPGPGERAEVIIGDLAGIVAPPVELDRGETSARLLTVGVPHLVVQVDDLAGVPVLDRGKKLRNHPALGAPGANVNFVSQQSGEWAIRTYERGVETETLACGTGAVATAAVLAASGATRLPCDIRTASGETLGVAGVVVSPTKFSQLRLSGEGRLVFRAVMGW